MIEIIWLNCDQVIKHHSEQIRRYGGQSGIRDQGLLDSALMRPRNLWAPRKIERFYKNAEG